MEKKYLSNLMGFKEWPILPSKESSEILVGVAQTLRQLEQDGELENLDVVIQLTPRLIALYFTQPIQHSERPCCLGDFPEFQEIQEIIHSNDLLHITWELWYAEGYTFDVLEHLAPIVLGIGPNSFIDAIEKIRNTKRS